jgi:hypothetical protein
VKRTNILAAFLVALFLISSGCGTSDYVQSVTLSAAGATSGGSFNLPGVDGALQLQATANYHSGKAVPVTDSVTFTVTTVGVDDRDNPLPAYGPTTVPINRTGLMQAVGPLCTWTDVPSGTPPVIPTPPEYNWVLDGYYQVIASYNGMVSNPVGVGVGSAAGNAPDGTCGPQVN